MTACSAGVGGVGRVHRPCPLKLRGPGWGRVYMWPDMDLPAGTTDPTAESEFAGGRRGARIRRGESLPPFSPLPAFFFSRVGGVGRTGAGILCVPRGPRDFGRWTRWGRS